MLKLKTRSNSGSDTLTRNPSRLGQNRWPCSISALSYYMTVAISIIMHHFQWKKITFLRRDRALFPHPISNGSQTLPLSHPLYSEILHPPLVCLSIPHPLLAVTNYCNDFDPVVRLVWTAKTSQRAANFRLLANQWVERRLVTQWRHGCRAMRRSVCNAGASNAGRPFAFRYQGNSTTPCQYIDTTWHTTSFVVVAVPR